MMCRNKEKDKNNILQNEIQFKNFMKKKTIIARHPISKNIQ